MKKFLYFLIFVLALGLTSCEKLHDWNQQDDPAIEYSSIGSLSGEWWVRYYVGDYLVADYSPLITSNTTADDGAEMWISDEGNFWTFKVKSACNAVNLSFASTDTLISTADYDGSLYNIGVLISNGRVIEDGGHSTSGIITDSIVFDIQFEDDGYLDTLGVWVPTPYETVFTAAGTRKTGFLEDEH